MSQVIATAGHVDHGKSTLVRALTGIEPDRWDEEKRRGLTIDLGYAWLTLPGGRPLAFVDVPGHRRFIGNMLAGLGPAPAVLFVVAADAGWSAQSEEHLRAVDALGVRQGIVAITRTDLADPAAALTEARERIARSSLGARSGGGSVEFVGVSARTGVGMPQLREALSRLYDAAPQPDPRARVRLWIDRSFSIAGSGTVATGTLVAGTLRTGETLTLLPSGTGGGTRGAVAVTVRGLQSRGKAVTEAGPVSRVAVNLRGIDAAALHRGDTLCTPQAWSSTAVIDVRIAAGEADALPRHLDVHVGSVAVPARVRPLEGAAARLTLDWGLPLTHGDRLILRDPGHEGAIVGAGVLDIDPPALRRRGAGAARGASLLAGGTEITLAQEIRRRGVLSHEQARRLGHDLDQPLSDELHSLPGYFATEATVRGWLSRLEVVVDGYAAEHPLEPTMPTAQAAQRAGLPAPALLDVLARRAGLQVGQGRIGRPGARPSLGAGQEGLDRIVAALTADPFAAPEQPDLDAAGLGPREIAAAVALGTLIRLEGDILLLPNAPARAMRELATLPQPFTTSAARQVLGTTRRVAIPLLEHLDARRWTRRVDAGHREVVR